MKTAYLALALAGVSLSACVSSGGSDTIQQLSSDLSSSGYVNEVVLASPPTNASANFQTTFQTAVGDKLKACATGRGRPLRLEANITEFKKNNAAATLLVGSSNMIKGTAKLIDPASGQTVGDYEISRSVGGGGVIALAAMSQAETQMSNAFADEICKRAFVRR